MVLEKEPCINSCCRCKLCQDEAEKHTLSCAQTCSLNKDSLGCTNCNLKVEDSAKKCKPDCEKCLSICPEGVGGTEDLLSSVEPSKKNPFRKFLDWLFEIE